jgi:N-acetylglucosaminyldiphosphoundecaprenol N-acetyl-beta-D-mannosaminyltransferase
MNSAAINFLGFSFLTTSPDGAVKEVCAPQRGQGRAFHLVNAFTLALAERSEQLQQILEQDLLFCDGKPLAFILGRRNLNVKQIRGADLMRAVLRKSQEDLSHFFLGSTQSVLDALLENARESNPKINIAGSFSPPVQDDFSAALQEWVEMLKDSQANVVWVGLGTPKQDFVVHEIVKQIPITAIAVGAAFDYLAGTLVEAPKFIQIIGFEWLFRLLKEPKRLWRRYLVGNLRFVRMVVCEVLKKK